MGNMGDAIGGFLEVVPPQMREPLLFVVFAGFSISLIYQFWVHTERIAPFRPHYGPTKPAPLRARPAGAETGGGSTRRGHGRG